MSSKPKQKLVVKIKDPRRFYPQWLKEQERQQQTYSATEDDLLSDLLTRWEAVVINDGKRKTFAKKYNRQAIDIILYHSKTGLVRDFVIKESDLRRHTKEELTNKRIGGTPKEYHQIVDEIFSNAVRRLFEELDLVYYHNHLAGKLQVRLEP
jgi:hypothetical protein